MGARRQVMHRLRSGVVRTARWPALGRVYRAIYGLQTERAARLFARVPGVRVVLLRGSAQRSVYPGLSDIDFVLVLEPDLDVAEELKVVDEIDAAAARVNRLAPLVADIHIVTGEELELSSRLGSPLIVMLQDAAVVSGSLDMPAFPSAPLLRREAMLRETSFWTCRALHQLLVEPPYVGQLLAGRSLAKADVFLDALARRDHDVGAAIRRCGSESERPRVGLRDALQRLWQSDQLLTDAPAIVTSGDDRAAPAWTRMAPRLQRWVAPLAEHRAVASVVLSAEGACEHDVRLFVALHPAHTGAPAALRALRRLLRQRRLLDRGYYSRAPLPLVVTTTMLGRPGFLRSTAAEPWTRARFGETLLGEASPAHGQVAEAARGVAHNLAGALIRARELWRRPMSPRAAAQWVDLAHGVIPMARSLVESGEVRVRAHGARDADLISSAPALRDPGRRAELFAELRDGFRVWLPRLSSMIEASMEQSPT